MKVKINIISPLIINSTDYINIPMVIDNSQEKTINMLDMENILMDSNNRKEITELFMDYFNSDNTEETFQKLQNYYSKMQKIEKYIIQPKIEYDELDKKRSNITLPIGNYIDNKYVPYIPGSSIKGAIRNALRNNFIKIGGSIDVSITQNKNRRKLDEQIFYMPSKTDSSQITDDVMRFIEVTDFYPIKNKYKLKIHKIVRTKSNNSGGRIPAYTVAIESGEFEGNITINKSLKFFKHLNSVENVFKNLGVSINIKDYDSSVKEILTITINYYKDLLILEKGYYKYIPANPLALGFGGGIELKTIIKSLSYSDFNEVKPSIISKNKKIKLNNDRFPSTHWEINGYKFGVVDLIY